MTSTGVFSAHGLTVRISSPDHDVVAAFDDVLVDMHPETRADVESRGPARAEPGGVAELLVVIDPVISQDAGAPLYRVLVDDEPVYETLTEGSVVSHVLMDINRRVTTAVWSLGLIPLHACTVAGPGGATLFAGSSHSGKTTLACALALAGARPVAFIADEVSALDPVDLAIVPYGKPAALRRPGLDLLTPRVRRLQRLGSPFEHDERFVPLSELANQPRSRAGVTAVVFPLFEAQSSPEGTARLAGVSPTEALTRLMRLTLGNERVGVESFRALERLVRNVAAYDLTYSGAFVAVDRLGAVLDARAPLSARATVKDSSA